MLVPVCGSPLPGSAATPARILVGIALDPGVSWKRSQILTISNLPGRDHRISLHLFRYSLVYFFNSSWCCQHSDHTHAVRFIHSVSDFSLFRCSWTWGVLNSVCLLFACRELALHFLTCLVTLAGETIGRFFFFWKIVASSSISGGPRVCKALTMPSGSAAYPPLRGQGSGPGWTSEFCSSVHTRPGAVQLHTQNGGPLCQLSSPGTLFGSQGPSFLTLWLRSPCFCHLQPPVLWHSPALPDARQAKQERKEEEPPLTLPTTGPAPQSLGQRQGSSLAF